MFVLTTHFEMFLYYLGALTFAAGLSWLAIKLITYLDR